MFKNDDMDERVSIKWNQILEKEDDLKEWAGEELDLSQEFENVDKEGNGSITFEQFTKELTRNHALTLELETNNREVSQSWRRPLIIDHKGQAALRHYTNYPDRPI